MDTVLNVALSGIYAAQRKTSVSANNIANVASTSSVKDGKRVSEPFMPLDFIQLSQENGGVITDVKPSGKEPQPVYEPGSPDANDNGIVLYPQIDPSEELANILDAKSAFSANLKVIESAKEMLGRLNDLSV